MTYPQSLLRSTEKTPPLTPEDWSLIVEALKAYRHHTAFHAVYEKVSHLHLAQEAAPRGIRVHPAS